MIRLGVIGSGRFAQKRIFPAASSSACVQLTALQTSSSERGQKLSAEWNIPHICSSLREMLPHVDAVWIASPHDQHSVEALLCAEKNIPVLCEKPFALTAAAALEMSSCFQKRGVPLLVGQSMRYLWSVEKAKELIPDMQHIEAYFTIDFPKREWRHEQGAALQDLGVHLVDLVRYLAQDEVVQVKAIGTLERFSALLQLERGVSAAIHASFTGPFSNGFTITSKKERLESRFSLVQTRNQLETFSLFHEDERHCWAPENRDIYALQLAHFSAVVQGKEDPLVPGDEGFKNAAVLEAIAHSLIH